jgi:ethanolamine transporter EutH
MNWKDLKIIAAGALGWTIAIPAVQIAGQGVAVTALESSDNKMGAKVIAVVVGVGIAAATTKLLSTVMGWTTQYERVRGVALALGTAQTIDGLVHIFYPTFYSKDPAVSVGCAGNIFLGAGLLGLFSGYA